MAWTGNTVSAIQAEIWAKEVERAAEPLKTMRRFCVVKDALISTPGDTLWIPKMTQVTGDGIAAGTDIEGNEADYTATALGYVPVDVKNGVKVYKSDLEKTPVALREEMAQALGNWYARKEDADIWTAAVDDAVAVTGLVSVSSGQTTQVKYGGDATSRATVDSSDTMSAALLSKAAARLSEQNAPKFMIGGSAYYVAILHPRQAYDLKQDSAWSAANRDAGIRGDGNRMFTGNMGAFDGVLCFESTQTKSVAGGWGCPAETVYQGVVMGERAIGLGVGQRVIWAEKDFDYGRLVGMATYTRYQAGILNYERIVRLETAGTDVS